MHHLRHECLLSHLGDAGLNQSQIQNATVLKQILGSNVGSVASKYSIPVTKLEGLVEGYQQAYDVGLTEVLLVAVAVFLVCAVLSWLCIPKNDRDLTRIDGRWMVSSIDRHSIPDSFAAREDSCVDGSGCSHRRFSIAPVFEDALEATYELYHKF